MSDQKIKGGMKEAEGKVQKKFGEAVDSPKHQAEGTMKEVEGKARKAAGDVEDELKKDKRR